MKNLLKKKVFIIPAVIILYIILVTNAPKLASVLAFGLGAVAIYYFYFKSSKFKSRNIVVKITTGIAIFFGMLFFGIRPMSSETHQSNDQKVAADKVNVEQQKKEKKLAEEEQTKKLEEEKAKKETEERAKVKAEENKKKAEEEALKAQQEEAKKASAESSTSSSSVQSNNSSAVAKQEQHTTNSGVMVWLSATGDDYHSIDHCGRMNPKKARQVTLEEAKRGYKPCSKCHPPQ
ncbi:hypothetical protein SAMN02745163_01325 [Clostridium cavendishii DSM 21758]|uniref:Uncharacterized protein n=1 Tax=Clostridium cavendishii DSM 21758 TaxID=1121302 RepID=A0A1M6GM31_9CLOT|nr:hypothetical protein [Clostridium cavendishii]SHJ11008.1 hypothetical protein SAMN02745163_01325 [Clostridium cavendishii DSM 21758]